MTATTFAAGVALRRAADLIHTDGLHTGDQFINRTTGAVDVAAAIYLMAEGGIPDAFYNDEVTSLAIIGASAPTMTAIRILSDSLPTPPSYTEIADGHEVPDYIEHVSNWATTTPVFGERPPTTSEVIGALLRAAQTADSRERRFGCTDANGFCLTCHGHGSLTTGTKEIPFEDLSLRRQQGYAAGHRFHRDITAPCPYCDGQDRATAAAEQAAESAA
ncbi:hypothetical protein ACFVS9_27975 [Streptomyces sp. NPDC058008]|uniref:DUF6197 family protein n=1 Tax=Streptomyces sp. NPDC058008 TaxID=3346303 RepID=UPI0036E9A353